MTLIVTAATHKFVAQVSDRRFTLPTGELFSDDANKAVLLDCQDAVFTFAYTGLGFIGRKRTDDWLVDLLVKVKATQLSAPQVIESVTEEATKQFRRLRVTRELGRLTLAVGIWPTLEHVGRRLVGSISNFETWGSSLDRSSGPTLARSRIHPKARPTFEEHFIACKPNVKKAAIVQISGRDGAITHMRKRLKRLGDYIVKNPEPDQVTRKLVAFVRRCADDEKEGTIGRDCMTVYVSDNVRQSTYFPEDNSRPVTFGPHLLTRNFVATDITIVAGNGKGPPLTRDQVERWKRLGKRAEPKWRDK